MVLGALLASPKLLQSLEPNDFADFDLREVLAELKRKDKTALRNLLQSLGVKWDGSGRALEAVLAACKAHGQREAARRMADSARRAGAASPDALIEYLRKLTGETNDSERA